jgi:ABC-2 type transport system ATP-binding protein
VRRDILNAIIRAVADDGRTAVFSSHLLDEVEQMSDYITMIDQGRVVLQGAVDDIKAEHHLLSIRFSAALESPPQFEGILSAEGQERTWNVVCNGGFGQVRKALETLGGEILCARNASLQEIFVARVGRDCIAGGEG